MCGIALLCAVSCSRNKTIDNGPDPADVPAYDGETPVEPSGISIAAVDTQHTGTLAAVLDNAEIPDALSRSILNFSSEDPAFIIELLLCLEGDPYLRKLVDKRHALPADYEPDDLVELGGVQGASARSYRVSRGDLMLRAAAERSLEEMAAAAYADGVTLTASSSYRSYDYQVGVYARNVREMGQEAADRESARPGHSQHQTGLVVDFGSIDDSFARTAAGRWMAANASRYGWSLSYPDGYEHVTGYRWESWHFRYVGKELAAFIDRYFDGIQQYGLRFIHEWENHWY